MSDELNDQIGALLEEMRRVNANTDAPEAHTEKARAEIASELSAADAEVAAAQAARETKASREETAEMMKEAIKAVLHETRSPSKAAMIGQHAEIRPDVMAAAFEQGSLLKGSLGSSYVPGTVLSAILDVNGVGLQGIDVERINAGKATLERLGLRYGGTPDSSKATLGTTGATGGYVLPNNLVDRVVKPATQQAVYQNLVTVINGVAVRGVDQPYRTGAPSRMTVAPWGQTKDNVDEAYGTYSATLYTLARIYDIGKQYARFSAGSAEQDVMDELTRGAILGENYYISLGAGTTEPTGVVTALAAGALTYNSTGSFTPAAAPNTIAGSAAKGLSIMLGALASRSREATAIVTDSATYWAIAAQGTDTAGFFLAPMAGPAGITPYGGLSFWGVPVLYDANLTAKTAIAGDWRMAKLYRGLEFRIETSDQAGDRWDKNLIGFRGEEEIGFNASTPVSVGAFQYLTNLIV